MDDACSAIVDCAHKTAPISPTGRYFAVGTPAMRGNRINFAEARRISESTFEAWTARLRPKAGDLLLAREAPVGPVVMVPDAENVAPGQRTVLLRPDPRVAVPRYLYYYLTSPVVLARLRERAAGSTVEHLNVSDVRSFSLDELPPVDTQHAIAAVLGALDDKIATNDNLARLLIDLIESSHRRTPQRSRTTHALADVLDVTYGEAFKGAHFTSPGTGRPLIRIRDLKTAAPQTWTTERRGRETLITPSEVVVGMDAEFRASWWLGEPGLLNQRVCRVRGRGFGNVLAALTIRPALQRLENEKSATTVIHLNKADLERSTVDLPPPEVVAEFEQMAEPLLDRRVAIAAENRRLTTTRDTLLPLLMSGKLRVKDAEKVVSDAV